MMWWRQNIQQKGVSVDTDNLSSKGSEEDVKNGSAEQTMHSQATYNRFGVPFLSKGNKQDSSGQISAKTEEEGAAHFQ